MVDREARDKLCELIEQWLDGEIGLQDLDERAGELDAGTKDPAVAATAWEICSMADWAEAEDVPPDEPTWKWLQREMLLLRSDAELVETSVTKWTRRQALAGAGALAVLLIVLGNALVWPTVIGVASIGLIAIIVTGCVWHWLATRAESKRAEEGPGWGPDLLNPFTSVGEMLAVRRSVPQFCRRDFVQREPRPEEPWSWPGLRQALRTVVLTIVGGGLVLAVLAVGMPIGIAVVLLGPDRETQRRIVVS